MIYENIIAGMGMDSFSHTGKLLWVLGSQLCLSSPVRLAEVAAAIGAIANTLRLELVDIAKFPPAAAAFIGALTAEILASLNQK